MKIHHNDRGEEKTKEMMAKANEIRWSNPDAKGHYKSLMEKHYSNKVKCPKCSKKVSKIHLKRHQSGKRCKVL